MEFRFVLGGPQEGGLETAAEVLSAAFAREGYGVFIDREYFSNIKGRHSYLHGTVRADGHPRYLDYPVNLVSGLDAETDPPDIYTQPFGLLLQLPPHSYADDDCHELIRICVYKLNVYDKRNLAQDEKPRYAKISSAFSLTATAR